MVNPNKSKLLRVDCLTWEDAKELAQAMTSEDAHECASLGSTPLQSLAAGMMLGYNKGVFRNATGRCVGAFGCNSFTGVAWSLWGNLTLSESKLVLRESSTWIEELKDRAGRHRPLHNFVSVDNKRALAWLKATGCFEIDEEVTPIGANFEPHHYFRTRSGGVPSLRTKSNV